MENELANSSLKNELRRLRKKLRQIEKLERLDRQLSEDEEDKVFKKFEIRSHIQELLTQCSEVSSVGSSMDPCLTPKDTPSKTVTRMQEIQEQVEHQPEEERDRGYGGGDAGGDQNQANDDDDDVTNEPPSKETLEENTNLRKRRIQESEKQATGESAPKSSDPRPSSSSPAHVELPKKPKATVTTQKAKGKEKKQEKKVVPQLTKEEQDALRFRESWKHCPFRVRYLEGHNDTVLSVAADSHLLVSGGRDTMVKVWDMDICAELKSFGGHTGTVTAVLLLSEEETKTFADTYELVDKDRIIISGSLDCSIKLWSLKTGFLLHSIYTYNSMTALGYLAASNLIVSGSDGGKLELWDGLTGNNVLSKTSHEDCINCIQVTAENLIFTASKDSLIKIHEYADGTFHKRYESEVLRTRPGVNLTPTPIRCITTADDHIYYGDEGFNIKVLEWKKGFVTKIRNHVCEFGITDCLQLINPLLVASGFDLDNAYGFLSVYTSTTHEYLGTLNDEDTSRILCMSCTKMRHGNRLRWVTGGDELKVWDQLSLSVATSSQEDVVDTIYDPRFLHTPDNSDLDSETDSGESDGEIAKHGHRLWRQRSRESSEPPGGWFSWCNIL
ncbi:F-box/WD repeat-containing protein 11-like isoform X2 [Lineus longissimus]|uniref:F-box/WD repeat-containing protein 11-like isoform X2 n=1 Tax=Lineus longissimus TaxID=88925 RepID=UPI00315CCB61